MMARNPARRADSVRHATFAEKQPAGGGRSTPEPPRLGQETTAMARAHAGLGRLATIVAVLGAPAFFLLFYRMLGWSLTAAIIAAAVAVFAVRGLFDVVSRRIIPAPTLFSEDAGDIADSVTSRRRAWFWRSVFRWVAILGVLAFVLIGIVYVVQASVGDATFAKAAEAVFGPLADQFRGPGAGASILGFAIGVPLIFLINTVIFIGPMIIAGLRQIKYYEPGDANWGVKMDDIRGQQRPKEEIRRIVQLWQAGDEFERAGGKRERGVLFMGAPGTGKTMLGKAIATGFNSPIVLAPGPAFSQAFIGVDVILVNWMTWRARRLARKWGGQCLVFIDEIDAVGMRRGALDDDAASATYFGAFGARNRSGDLILENEDWREHVFSLRYGQPRGLSSLGRVSERVRQFAFPGMQGVGQSALQSLLVAMDGFAEPRALRRIVTKRLNTLLDATYVVPSRIGRLRLRLPPAPAREEQLFFIGACNVPLASLDPALTRPGRMGRHVRFRTPNRADRRDIFDYYLDRVAHEAEIDRPERREELAAIAMGHSPAMIQQVCSLALTNAHGDGRSIFGWQDLLDAITVIEQGLDAGLTYVADEARSLAIHEAGHAVTGHFFMRNRSSSRLTITPRDGSLGHHAMHEVEERYSKFQHEEFADIVWALGAMAAETVFYGETSTGVGGDIEAATSKAAYMVGHWGMAPTQPDLSARFSQAEESDAAETRLMERYARLGARLMNRTAQGSQAAGDPIAAVLEDVNKRTMVAQLLGQAFLTAFWFIRHNRTGVERVAETLIERRDMYGSEVTDLLNSVNLQLHDTDPLDESLWPTL